MGLEGLGTKGLGTGLDNWSSKRTTYRSLLALLFIFMSFSCSLQLPTISSVKSEVKLRVAINKIFRAILFIKDLPDFRTRWHLTREELGQVGI